MSAGDAVYATTVATQRGSAEVVVRLRDLGDLLYELEATGRQGVDLRGAVCAGVLGPGWEEAVRGLLPDVATDLDVARAVFGEDTRPVPTGIADTYLLRCTPLEAPEAEVEGLFAR